MRPQDNLFVQLSLHMQLITQQQVQEYITYQRQYPGQQSISQFFCTKGYISRENLHKLQQHICKSTLKKRYVIFEEIGHGGMGTVYKAFDLLLNKKVALKKLQQPNSENLERFLREIRSVAKLHHPNIIKMYDVVNEQGFYFFSMDLVIGKTLAQVLQENISREQIIDIFIKIGDAVHYAHRHGVIHRDLKPENIMLTDQFEPVIMDFGLAKEVNAEKISVSGIILGTPSYMSPEQANASNDLVDERSDLYSLGVVLYEVLTKQLPFTAPQLPQLLIQICIKDPVAPSTLDSSLPPELDRICLKALEKEREKRYQSVADFVDDLLRFKQGKNVRAHMPRKWTRIIRKIKRDNTIRTSLIAVILTVSILSTVIAIWGYRHNLQQTQSLLSQASNIFHSASDYEALSNYKTQTSPYSVYSAAEQSLYKYREALAVLQQVSQHNEHTKNLLFTIEKQMGLVAILVENYMLSELCFAHCQEIAPQKSRELFQILNSKRTELKNQRLESLQMIMNKANGPLVPGMIDEYITTILKMPEPYIVKDLLRYTSIPTSSSIQKKIAAEALGKIGDRNTKYQEKDAVEWLMFTLKNIDIKQEESLVEAIIWALGRLRDPRANEIVFWARRMFGESSPLFWRTELPYSWIPLDKKTSPNSMEAFFVQGAQKMDRKDYIGAIADFTSAIAINPHPQLLLTRASAYEKTQNFKEAFADYARILQLSGDKILVADVYSKRAILFAKQGNYEKALRDFNRSIAMNPQPSLYYNNRGFFFLTHQKLDLALKDFSEAIRRNKNSFPAYSNRARVYFAKDMWHNAIQDIDQAIRINPRWAGAYVDRGYAYEKIGNTQKAVENYLLALKENPNLKEAYNNLGGAYYRQGNVEKALEMYKKTISIDKNFGPVYYQLGRFYEDKKMWHKALENYSIALRSEKITDPGLILKDRALVYKKLKLYKFAVQDWKKYLKLNPKSTDRDEIQNYINKYSR